MIAQIGVTTFAVAVSAAVTISAALVGLVFRGAATAWREERDAAVDKSERLEAKVDEQAGQIAQLEAKVVELEHRTNYEVYAERSAREHQAILDGLTAVTAELKGLDSAVKANTAAVELVARGSALRQALEDHEGRTE